jgi:hypothetical protein
VPFAPGRRTAADASWLRWSEGEDDGSDESDGSGEPADGSPVGDEAGADVGPAGAPGPPCVAETWRWSDQRATGVRRGAEEADDEHDRQQGLEDLHRSPPGKSAGWWWPRRGEDVSVSILKTRFPGIWLPSHAGGALSSAELVGRGGGGPVGEAIR